MTMPRTSDGSDPPVPSDERTTLSWERTALSLFTLLAALVTTTWTAFGYAALLPLVPMAVVSVWVVIEGWRSYDDDQYFRVYRAIGGPTAVLASTVALAGVLEMVHLLTR